MRMRVLRRCLPTARIILQKLDAPVVMARPVALSHADGVHSIIQRDEAKSEAAPIRYA